MVFGKSGYKFTNPFASTPKQYALVSGRNTGTKEFSTRELVVEGDKIRQHNHTHNYNNRLSLKVFPASDTWLLKNWILKRFQKCQETEQSDDDYILQLFAEAGPCDMRVSTLESP